MSVENGKYLRRLIYELRLRGRSNAEIKDIVAEVESTTAPGQRYDDEFGAPEEYASQFEKLPVAKGQRSILYISVIVAIGWLAFGLIAASQGWFSTGTSTLFATGPAALILVLGLAGNFIWDFYRPLK